MAVDWTIQPELIGSAAVPMKGKKEIDILIVSEDPEVVRQKLSENGYGKGHIEIGDAIYFTKYDNDIEVQIQIVKPGSYKDKTSRLIVQKLKQNKSLREEFEKLKMSLNGLPRNEYRKKKGEFIQKILTS